MALVRLRGPLRRSPGAPSTRSRARRSLSCCARSSASSPALRGWILDERGRIRRHINVFVNGEQGDGGHGGRAPTTASTSFPRSQEDAR